MHSSCGDDPGPSLGGAETLVAIAALVTEGRIPSPPGRIGDLRSGQAFKAPAPGSLGFSEGPHCSYSKAAQGHVCNLDNQLCIKYEKINSYVLSLWQKNIPLCIQVLLVPKCCCPNDLLCNMPTSNLEQLGSAVLLEEWHINVIHRRTHDLTNLNINQLINAIRSQLYFSQITAWLASPDEKIRKSFPNNSVVYCLTIPGETYGCQKFTTNAQKHNFPLADIGNGIVLKVSLSNLPRCGEIPLIKCSKCNVPMTITENINVSLLDDRMQTSCTIKGKHRCDEYEDYVNSCRNVRLKQLLVDKRVQILNKSMDNNASTPSTSRTITNNINNASSSSGMQESSSKIIMEKPENIKTDLELSKTEFNEVLNVLRQSVPAKKNDLKNKGDILLDAILRSSKSNELNSKNDKVRFQAYNFEQKSNLSSGIYLERNKRKCVNKTVLSQLVSSDVYVTKLCDKISCDNKKDFIDSDNISISENDIYIDINCDTVKRKKTEYKMRDISNVFSLEYLEKRQKVKVKQKISFDEEQNNNSNKKPETITDDKVNKGPQVGMGIPTASDQAKFRKNLDSAASMVFHSRTGLPLTSSPAPVRRGKSCFDFDSSINSVSAIRSALFSLAPNCSADEDSESDCSIVSPCSPDAANNLKQCKVTPYNYHRRGQSAGLLGSFEESVLNGRLEPVSTVHGFTAELGASGSFCPRHVVLPVTVFFYTLGDNDKVSTPYLGHINLGKKGYNVPKSGTIQVTLFNPLGTVVKMFVIMYDLSDMPANSQTFIRQRTLYMPANLDHKDVQWSQKWLRYLVHLRFMSSKSGRIYLHSDIRMIICRKSDLDTATAHGIDMSYELRSFTHSPANPKFSPRK